MGRPEPPRYGAHGLEQNSNRRTEVGGASGRLERLELAPGRGVLRLREQRPDPCVAQRAEGPCAPSSAERWSSWTRRRCTNRSCSFWLNGQQILSPGAGPLRLRIHIPGPPSAPPVRWPSARRPDPPAPRLAGGPVLRRPWRPASTRAGPSACCPAGSPDDRRHGELAARQQRCPGDPANRPTPRGVRKLAPRGGQ